MRKAYAIPKIEDVTFEGCYADVLPLYLDIFERCMKATAVCRARTAIFDLSDFTCLQDHGIGEGTLTIERRDILNQIQWFGRVVASDAKVKIIGTLEAN
ncbi:hypothetical protein MED193_12648 [Roseobacter sp. MED193]|uniref:hypothetical protein n=1 Tax=Roseobacter sp. MED193 TaxID=314262 RepID=UPI000068E404|nr:hypothetical protein [Roseobacter sp. MED193]EAQ43719.1 hypothetical protein MED193_12648 [Roseobacter sp. MED193]